MFELTDRRRLCDRVADGIRDYIVRNQLGPGDKLPTESELAEHFGVSRVSIREATKALGFLGFLEASPRRGTTIRQVDLRRVTEFLELHPSLRDASAQQLIDARTVIEVGTLPYLMECMRNDASIYEDLHQRVDRFRSVDNLAEFIELDRDFHGRLVEASGVTPLQMFHDLLLVFFERVRRNVEQRHEEGRLQAEFPAGAASHQRIIDSLRDGHLDLAQQELRTHIGSQRARLAIDSG
jgi:DNA-binding FadR family transcriptional regulator